MKILEVSYRSLRTGRGYNNTSVEARAAVEEGRDPEEVLNELRAWVDGQVDEQLKRQEAYEKLSDVYARVGNLQREEEQVEKRVAAYRELLKDRHKLADLARKHGLGGDALLLDNI